ncbi:LysR family transcriptional regulator [Bradyrhizobium japonicum]|uniref:LysR family transcriptional regulator n=1 Tax=Bradyrhizobium japonicum TaxID=375 RepID=UPI0005A87696|nr:LysR family transcriptional regulator [Bradyrhizobium japonicum]MCS3497751.1 DNA-binding transcriptional LysR family regulator [Bradyrhizobium japonicum]MCS3960088.1 DNA-binding transcriptional LysR family regulator [Bradyrhizobium japonicum]MCS4001841.1 DNA-binding transcriptional LysR family regulator [Bradyrhizobium japonicum]MCW2221035.1 DNA-binding transcriptional LysR family regulator [Bradyrhizobium japonicum]MCW2345647.1 DNA-binding transcriptional LysR family regulator [Bradyrhizob
MDVGDLKAFEAVARLGSMNRAAAELNTVQSNITTKIRNLEFELKVRLFQRSARGVELTPAGRRLLPFPPRLGKLLSDAKAAARDDGPPTGQLRIGALETTAALRLPHVLASFARSYPSVKLALTTGTTCSLMSDVVDGRLDGALVNGPVERGELDNIPMFREELALVTPASIRSLNDLASIHILQTVVFGSGCAYRYRLNRFLADRGLSAASELEFGSIDAIIGCIEAGVGLSLLPVGVLDRASRGGLITIHRLPPEQAIAQTEFIHRRDTYLSSAMSAFIQLMRDHNSVRLEAAE